MPDAVVDPLMRLSRSIGNVYLRFDDDFVDRLHHVYSVTMMIIFASVLTMKQYTGEPIYCWLPFEYRLDHMRYAENMCFVSNTYFVPFQKDIPMDISQRQDKEIAYYQFYPFALLLQALAFYLPCTIWRVMSTKTGINMKNLVEMGIDSKNLDPKRRETAMEHIATHLTYCLKNQRDDKSKKVSSFLFQLLCNSCRLCERRYGIFLSLMYMFMKLLNAGNIFLQLWFLDFYLGPTHFGFDIIYNMWDNHNWELNGAFPRVGYCDIQIRNLANVVKHTIQCVLPINVFAEKIYIFMWIWLLALGAVTVINMLSWAIDMILPWIRTAFIKHDLNLRSSLKHGDKQDFNRFIRDFIRHDGYLILKLLSQNAGHIVATDVLHHMWFDYKKKRTFGPPSENAPLVNRNQHPGRQVLPSAPPDMEKSLARNSTRLPSVGVSNSTRKDTVA